jgi:hypothetical protein
MAVVFTRSHKVLKFGSRQDPDPNNDSSFFTSFVVLRFVQYFLVSGLDVNFGLEPDDANLSLDPLAGDNSPLERSYKPRILR